MRSRECGGEDVVERERGEACLKERSIAIQMVSGMIPQSASASLLMPYDLNLADPCEAVCQVNFTAEHGRAAAFFVIGVRLFDDGTVLVIL